MLQSIRDYTQGWIASIIISLLIFSFAIWGVHSYLASSVSGDTVAKVNGTEISKNQLATTYERMRRQLQMQLNTSQLPPNVESELKEKSLQSLIEIEVLKKTSIAASYRISTSQIDNYLASMPEFQIDGKFSPAQFQNVLNAMLFTAKDFIEFVKTSLLIAQPRLGIIFTSMALPDEVSHAIALVGQEREIQYLIIPYKHFSEQKIAISDQKIQEYYNQHKETFKSPEQLSIQYVELNMKDVGTKVNLTDDALKSFYNENSNMFTTPSHWKLDALLIPLKEDATTEEESQANKKAQEIFRQAKTGKDFSSLQRNSNVTSTLKNLAAGVTIKQVPVELQNAVLNMTTDHQVSEPVRTGNGIVILKVLDYQPGKIQPFSAVKDKVEEVYIKQKSEENYANMREKLANITYEHPDTLETAANELGLSIKTTSFFTRGKGGQDISSDQKVRDAAFSNEVLTLQNNSDVIQMTPGSVIVLRVKTYHPAAQQSLDSVKSDIVAILKQEAMDARTSQLATTIVNKLRAGHLSIEQAYAQYSFPWNKVGYVSRHAEKIPQAVIEAAFELPKPLNDKSTYGTAKTTNGYAVIAVTHSRDGHIDPVSRHQQYQAFAEQVQNSQGLLEYELYKKTLMQHAKINVNS